MDTMLRDRFVCGIEHSAMPRKLLTEPELTLKKAVYVAMSIEAAEKDVRTLREMPADVSVSQQRLHKVTTASHC